MKKKKLYLINIKKKSLGETCSIISNILKGKIKKIYINNKTNGDLINLINSEKIYFSGKYKYNKKIIYKPSIFPGKLKKIFLKNFFKINKKKFMIKSTKNMIKNNNLRNKIIKNLKICKNINYLKLQKLKILNI